MDYFYLGFNKVNSLLNFNLLRPWTFRFFDWTMFFELDNNMSKKFMIIIISLSSFHIELTIKVSSDSLHKVCRKSWKIHVRCSLVNFILSEDWNVSLQKWADIIVGTWNSKKVYHIYQKVHLSWCVKFFHQNVFITKLFNVQNAQFY